MAWKDMVKVLWRRRSSPERIELVINRGAIDEDTGVLLLPMREERDREDFWSSVVASGDIADPGPWVRGPAGDEVNAHGFGVKLGEDFATEKEGVTEGTE